MRYLGLAEVVDLHRRILQVTGGAMGLRDLRALESAIAQPQATFSGVDLYPTLAEKAAALCFALIQGHPFVDGNKRVGHAAMETFLVLNGSEVEATVEDQERLALNLAAGRMGTKPTGGLVASASQAARLTRQRKRYEEGRS
jgi:death-on-curing protein